MKDWKEGGENSHKVQYKSLVEIRAIYAEKANCKRELEIEEQLQMARFGVSSRGETEGGQGPAACLAIALLIPTK